MNYKIVNNTLYLSDRWGNKGRQVATGVAFVTFEEVKKIFLVTKMDGILEIRDMNGNLIRKIANGVLEARFSGGDIVVRKKDGKNCIIDRYGNHMRWI